MGGGLLKWKVTELMTSINEALNLKTLFPNPASGKIELKYNVIRPNIFQYEITNISGQIMIRNNLGFKNIGENNNIIDVSNLPIGHYNLKLFSENEVINLNFIKGE